LEISKTTTLRLPAPLKGKPLRLACFSDLHLWSRACALDRLTAGLNDAVERDCYIMLLGDVLDAIVWNDPRYVPGLAINDETDPIQLIIEKVADYLEPYADRILWIGAGNHESAFRKHHHTDPITLLIAELQKRRKKNRATIIHAGYRGFMRVQFFRPNVAAKNNIQICSSDIWYYDHGRGGGAPVTKGLIDFARVSRDFVADVYWFGHKHTSPDDHPRRIQLDHQGSPVIHNLLCFYTAGYQSEVDVIDYTKLKDYRPDWASEKFHQVQAEGHAIVEYTGKMIEGYYEAQRRLIKGGPTTTSTRKVG
jgi:UDP-2,3-diacylglucosamine pyrophosphatase LpxH